MVNPLPLTRFDMNIKTITLVLSFVCVAFTSCAAADSTTKGQPLSGEGDAIGTLARPTSFPSDDAMLDYIQRVHLNYMWDGADHTSGLARERIHLDGIYPDNDQDIVTIGGSGFGVAGLIVGMDRGFINRQAGVERLRKIVSFLGKADRFHGVWPHWLHANTGKVKPFGKQDDGGDLVESSFLMEGLLCARQYLRDGNAIERQLSADIDSLWQGMDYAWYRNGGRDVLYWHWSPDYGWVMNYQLKGYNEALVTYILAASSPTHPVPAECYRNGWARDGAIKSDAAPYGHALELKHNYAEATGGPLFWAHYSYIGLDPRCLSDEYASYWDVVRNHAMSDYAYCVANPNGYKGYGKECWGLTASYSINGYAAHAPNNDLGVISPTAALSSFPYTPGESMAALKYFWSKGQWIWGKYGFYDALSEAANWTTPRYLAIDQLTIAPMIENYRSGLLWKLFMSCPEIQVGLGKLGFTINN